MCVSVWVWFHASHGAHMEVTGQSLVSVLAFHLVWGRVCSVLCTPSQLVHELLGMLLLPTPVSLGASLCSALCEFWGSELKPSCLQDKCFTQCVCFWSHFPYGSACVSITLGVTSTVGFLLIHFGRHTPPRSSVQHGSVAERMQWRCNPDFLSPSHKIPRLFHNLCEVFRS